MSRLIFHIDVNSAYLSWSALSLLEQGSPVDLRDIPAIIGGDMEKRHGIVLAKSIPAKKYGIVGGSTNQYMAKCVANEFGSTQKFVDFMKNVFYQLDEPNLKVIENDYLKKLSKKVKLAIVSNSSRNYLLHYLKRFKIDESNFEYILQNEYEMTNYSKGVKYELLLKTLNLNPQEALVIGDNYETDIKPALSMNINAVHTHNLESVKKAVSQFIEF